MPGPLGTTPTTQSIAYEGEGGGAPTTAEYLVGAADAGLSAERVVTNTATVTWDLSTPGQAKANATGGGGGDSFLEWAL